MIHPYLLTATLFLATTCWLKNPLSANDLISQDLRTTVEFQATSQDTRIGASPDRATYEANIQALIQKRFPDLDDTSPGLALVVHTAGRYFDTRQGKHRGSTIDSIDNNALAALGRRYQHYQAILKAWQQAGLPRATMLEWQQHVVDYLKDFRIGDLVDTVGWQEQAQQWPKGFSVVHLEKDSDAATTLIPQWDDLRPLAQRQAMLELARLNPWVRCATGYRATKQPDGSEANSVHTGLPLGDGHWWVEQWEIASTSVLVPPAAQQQHWYNPTTVDLSSLPFASLKDLDLNGVETLILQSTSLPGLSSLVGVSTLRHLNVDHNRLQAWTALAEMRQLTALSANKTNMTDLTVCANLPLQRLHLNHTTVDDLSPLRAMKTLRDLELEETLVTDLKPLSTLPIERLNIEGTQITNLKPLQRTPLTWVNIDRCPVEDLEPLRGKDLTEIVMTPGKIYDNMAAIAYMTSIKRIAYRSREGWLAWFGTTKQGLKMSADQAADTTNAMDDDDFGLGLED